MQKANSDALHFPFTEVPDFGSTLEVLPGILWLRMPLPLALDHINLYLVDAGSGWYIIDTGLKYPAIRKHWEALFEHGLLGRPVPGVAVTQVAYPMNRSRWRFVVEDCRQGELDERLSLRLPPTISPCVSVDSIRPAATQASGCTPRRSARFARSNRCRRSRPFRRRRAERHRRRRRESPDPRRRSP